MASTTESAEETQRAAVKQVEFYFHDSNLPYDKYMWTLHTKTLDRWVPISIVASFKRMRAYRDAEDQGLPWVVDALRKYSFLEVDESGENLRRKDDPQPPEGVFDRSVYAKGFGTDEKEGALLIEIENFFGKWGKVNAVRMRRDHERKFKASVFAEFDDLKSATAFLEAPQEERMWDGQPLVTYSKEAYCLMKMEEKGIPSDLTDLKKGANHPSTGAKDRRFNAFTVKDASRYGERIAAGGKLKDVPASRPISIHYGSDEIAIQPDGTVKDEDIKVPAQSVIVASGVGSERLNFGDVKTKLKTVFEKAPHIQTGDDKSTVHFVFTSSIPEEQFEKISTLLPQLGGADVTFSRATGEVEREQHVLNITQLAANAIAGPKASNGRDSSNSRGGGRGRGRGRGGRGGGGGGGRDSRKSESKPASTGPKSNGAPPSAPPIVASSLPADGAKRKAEAAPADSSAAKKPKTD